MGQGLAAVGVVLIRLQGVIALGDADFVAAAGELVLIVAGFFVEALENGFLGMPAIGN